MILNNNAQAPCTKVQEALRRHRRNARRKGEPYILTYTLQEMVMDIHRSSRRHEWMGRVSLIPCHVNFRWKRADHVVEINKCKMAYCNSYESAPDPKRDTMAP
jgi:hypothetical protein